MSADRASETQEETAEERILRRQAAEQAARDAYFAEKRDEYRRAAERFEPQITAALERLKVAIDAALSRLRAADFPDGKIESLPGVKGQRAVWSLGGVSSSIDRCTWSRYYKLDSRGHLYVQTYKDAYCIDGHDHGHGRLLDSELRDYAHEVFRNKFSYKSSPETASDEALGLITGLTDLVSWLCPEPDPTPLEPPVRARRRWWPFR